jgi:hypothetical protein
MRRALALICLAVAGSGASASGTGWFPFVLRWDDSSKTIVDVSGLNHRPAGRHGFVRIRDGHLATSAGRQRFFGVNICMDACFPEHADAEKVAARMAKFGINCVRFHHMDMDPAPRGIWAADGRTLDPGQLDRLDYFIAQLKKNGIYADLNLHVSRVYPGFPEWEGGPSFHKGVDNFMPGMLHLQRAYARDLLGHVNPYTKTRYAVEPAVALVEINNENGLLQVWGDGQLDRMPGVFTKELTRQWNAWLAKRYPNGAALRKAWKSGSVPLGPEMLRGEAGAWNLEQHNGAMASIEPAGNGARRIAVTKAGDQGWFVQYNQAGLRLRAGVPYTYTFRARSDEPRTVNVNAMQAHAPWTTLWSEPLDLTTDWQTFTFVFRPSASDDNARIGFGDLGNRIGAVEVADLSLRSGGSTKALEGAAPGRVPWFPHRGFSSLPQAAKDDWVRFLWDTEVAYWTGMYRYIRKDLGARALIIGTQVSNSPGPIQAKMDVVDNHAYWKHPSFPRRPWDGEDWTVENVPMAGDASTGTLAGLAWRRPFGKPYIVTEYNHPAPNSYGAEMMPLLCAYASLQDWDGVFAFDYCSNRSAWTASRIGGFFSIGNHPVKMATLPSAAAMFLRGDVRPSASRQAVALTPDIARAQIGSAGTYIAWGAPPGCDPLEAVRRSIGWTAAPTKSARPSLTVPVRSDTGQLLWGAPTTIETSNACAVIGPLPEEGVSVGDFTVSGDGNWAVVTMVRLGGSVLVTAAGDARNTGMQWKDAARNSVGSRWGTAPTEVEAVSAKVRLDASHSEARVWALDETGRRTREVPVVGKGNAREFVLGGEYRTLWYEVQVTQASPAR